MIKTMDKQDSHLGLLYSIIFSAAIFLIVKLFYRFPAYDVVEIKPDIKPSYAMDRLWLRATAPDFNKTIDIKVNIFNINLIVKNLF